MYGGDSTIEIVKFSSALCTWNTRDVVSARNSDVPAIVDVIVENPEALVYALESIIEMTDSSLDVYEIAPSEPERENDERE